MKHETREKNAQKKMLEARKVLDEIEQDKWYIRNKPLQGKCFRYLNSYGSGDPSWYIPVGVNK